MSYLSIVTWLISLEMRFCAILDPQYLSKVRNLLEGFTELQKAVVLTVTVYYSERIHIKVRIRKKYIGQSPEKTSHKLPVVLSQRSCTDTYLTQQNA